ncbi:hypothetical protein WJX81_006199 [Elliptochloris bilobata]|uniref:Beta-glucosidase n=1 Tax=Elliptochloris bilobata TaxID=381761 RepID=A0AAW1R316_9CHLO
MPARIYPSTAVAVALLLLLVCQAAADSVSGAAPDSHSTVASAEALASVHRSGAPHVLASAVAQQAASPGPGEHHLGSRPRRPCATEAGQAPLSLSSPSAFMASSLTPTFWWGTATAAYQVEGYTTANGRGASIWDTFSATPGKTYNGESGEKADEFYKRYPADIKLMQSLGVRHFRMSVAWPRILPKGTGTVNQAGVNFYVTLVDALKAADIQPYVTLYHWDLPQTLQDSYGGWGSSRIVNDFAAYADVVFKALGSRVTYWTTFNEPWSFCFMGNANGQHAPGLTDRAVAWNCAYHVLLAHAAAVKKFRAAVPGGKIGMNINSDWSEPFSSSSQDQAAADRKVEFMAGIFGDPLYLGDWPASVKQRVPNLPTITSDQARDIKGSTDYFALNHYTTLYVKDAPGAYGLEGLLDASASANGPEGLVGPQADSSWLYTVPWGIRKMLNWVNNRYHPGEIYVTENGCDVPGESGLALPEALNDTFRVNFYQGYVQAAAQAAAYDGVPLKGYFAWSLLDNFEWADGYAKRFGIVYVDYSTQARYVKRSARYLANLFGTVGSA